MRWTVGTGSARGGPSFLKEQAGDTLKFHHEFRVTVVDCPNVCSQPQIKDVGIETLANSVDKRPRSPFCSH